MLSGFWIDGGVAMDHCFVTDRFVSTQDLRQVRDGH